MLKGLVFMYPGIIVITFMPMELNFCLNPDA